MLEETVVAYHAREIRKLAAACQSGAHLADIKKRVDLVISEVSRAAGGDSDHRIRMWSALLVSVERYITNQCDPKWTDVMRYATQKIKMRRRTCHKKRIRRRE